MKGHFQGARVFNACSLKKIGIPKGPTCGVCACVRREYYVVYRHETIHQVFKMTEKEPKNYSAKEET